MRSNVQPEPDCLEALQPGLHVVDLGTTTKIKNSPEVSADMPSSVSCRFAFPVLHQASLEQALSQKMAEADQLFDWSHKMPAPNQARQVMSLVAQLGCLIVGRHKPFHEMEKHALRFANAAFMESDLDDRFSRFIETLHEWAQPPGVGDAFVSYSRCLSPERQLYILMFLDSCLDLIGKLVDQATKSEHSSSYIILDGIDLFFDSTSYAEAFMASVQAFAASADVVVLGASSDPTIGSTRHKRRALSPALAG